MEDKPQDEAHKLTMEGIKELVRDSKRVHANRVTSHEYTDVYSFNREVSEQEESVVDTKTLVVGQKVWIESGRYVYRGIVAKITPSGVEVNSGGQLFHFDSEGKGCNSEGTPKYGPRHIDEMPFTKRIALWEEEIRKFRKTLVVGQEVWMESGIYSDKGTVIKITPSHVYVQTDVVLIRFDSDGKSCDGHGTFECGPWEIKPEDMIGKW